MAVTRGLLSAMCGAMPSWMLDDLVVTVRSLFDCLLPAAVASWVDSVLRDPTFERCVNMYIQCYPMLYPLSRGASTCIYNAILYYTALCYTALYCSQKCKERLRPPGSWPGAERSEIAARCASSGGDWIHFYCAFFCFCFFFPLFSPCTALS